MARATARHILVDSQQAAEDLKTRIDAGADFAEVAREHSSCPSKSQGGDLGEVDSWTLHLMTGSEPVPSVSEWGLAVLTLLLLSAGTIVFVRRGRHRLSGDS